jgi:ferredoxin
VTVQTTFRVTTTDGDAFEVEEGEIVLDAALRQGVDIPYSCRSGECRTCLSRVLSGRVEHEPEYADDLMLGQDEIDEGYRLLCSSLAHDDSEIDVGW